ncbi:aldehyde dehydrogenase family protein [Shinella sp. S4-D37]|uniref:aldehyde dehydrogenase family protein n=1 Tax=Shinella sp. S4-D37 TaxID=3161999 RepID=UPI0034668B6E
MTSFDDKQRNPIVVRHLIDGAWVDGDGHVETRSPYSGELVGQVAKGSLALVEQAIVAARAAAPRVAAVPPHERARILHQVSRLIVERADEIGIVMARETGKAVKDATGEVRRSQDTITLSAEEAVRIEGAHIPLDASEMGSGKIAMMMRFPVGVVGAVTPFNAPFNLACHKLGPALAAGNAVVLKPPPQAAAVVHLLAEIFVDAGIPAGALNVVHGDIDIGKAIVQDPRVDFVTFTGSSSAGAHIKAATGLRRVALELGGAGQTIVHSDADVSVAAPMCGRNAVRLAGQSCISVQTVYVHRTIAAAFVERLVREVKSLRVGDPLDGATDVGTVIDEAAAERIVSWVSEAKAAGATILTGGQRNGAQVEPTVLINTRPDMQVICKEVFGPVVSIIEYDEIEEAYAAVNASSYGLQCGLFTKSNEVTLQAYRTIRTGNLVVNGTSTWRTDQLAYGGVKDSGIGREGPRYAIRDMTEERILLFNL